MSTKYKFGDSSKLYFVSFAVINWIDVFIRNEYKDILLNSFTFCTEKKGLEIYSYVIPCPGSRPVLVAELTKSRKFPE